MKFVVPLTMPRTRLDPVGGEVAGQRTENGDAATDGRLEPERRAGPPGGASSSGAVVGEHVLVGRHDRLAHRQRGRDQRAGRLVAAHQLHDHVDVGVGDEMGRRVGQELGRQPGRGRPATSRTATAVSCERRPPSDGREVVRTVPRARARPPARRPRAEHGNAQPGTAHDVARAGRDIGRMVADRSERLAG